MPYASQKQRGKFHAMEQRGQISSKVVKEFDDASKGLKLPKGLKRPVSIKRRSATG